MKAIILCGGKGERLRPLTDDRPKPLVKIDEKSTLEYLLLWLSSTDIKEIFLTAGYLSSEIQEFVRNHKSADFDITVIDNGDCDIIERLISCEPNIVDKALVLYGDTLADIDYEDLKNLKYKNPEKDVMSAIPLRSSFGLFEIDNAELGYNFREKPTLDYWINIGYFVFQKETFYEMKRYSNFADFLTTWTNGGRFCVYKHLGAHITINTITELELAKEQLKKLGWSNG